MSNKEYNFKYLLELSEKDEGSSYELKKIMDSIDKHVSEYKPNYLFHLVPILYSMVFVSGFSFFIYKVL